MKLDLERFREINVQRAKEGFRCYDNQPLTYWTTALAGEVGELCNMIKKMQRVAVGGVDGGSSYSAKDITPEMLKEEIGGIAIYLDLLASLLDISLEQAVIDTFDGKSRQLGFSQYVDEAHRP
jgi:NTP pyrophosphatase (non-canonical NTP hydrolase)